MKQGSLGVAALALVVAFPFSVFADKVHVRGLDEVIEGEVTEEGDEVVILTRHGVEVRIARSKVVRIERPGDPKPVESPRPRANPAEDARREREARAEHAWTEATKWLRKAALAKKDRERAQALDELARIEATTTRAVLIYRLERGEPEERRLAAELLGERKGNDTLRALARAVVLDDVAAVRMGAVAALTSHANPETGLLFVQALERKTPIQRMRAVEAIRFFPRLEALPALMNTGSITTGGDTGRHRAHIFVGTDRAYIAGWELSSGGTGTNVAEVARPLVERQQEGVQLEVDVKFVLEQEWVQRTRVLSSLTGQKHETPAAWREWWAGAKASFKLPEGAGAR